MEESKEKWICLNCGKENEKEVQKCLYCKISKPTPLKVRKGKDNPKTLVQINTLEKITEE